MLAITILDCAGAGGTTVIGGASISLFAKNGTFRQGMFDLRVWIGVEADGNADTRTPGKFKDTSKNQMQRLAKLAKKHRNGQVPKVDWLDRLTFREIEMINEKEKTESDYLYLLVEFPTVCCERTNQTVRSLLCAPQSRFHEIIALFAVLDCLFRAGRRSEVLVQFETEARNCT